MKNLSKYQGMMTNTTGNVLDYLYYQKYCKRIGTDLTRQKKISILQQIKFTKKLEKDNGATMLFIAKAQQKSTLNISLDSVIITE